MFGERPKGEMLVMIDVLDCVGGALLSVWLFSRDTIMNVFSDSCDTPRSSLVNPRFKDSELQYKFANGFARATLAPRIRSRHDTR